MESRRGRLLVAAPTLEDPNFLRTVVLLMEHGEEGALGVILNRAGELTVEEAVPLLSELAGGETLVHAGGPVQPEAVIALVELRAPDRDRRLLTGRVGVVEGDEDIGALAADTDRARVFAGYAGWGPGQLETEIDREDWIDASANPDDVFTSDPDALWSDVLARKGGRFALVARMPLDPSVN